MDKALENSVKAAYKEFEEEPMDDYYNNKLAGYPSRLRVKKIISEISPIKNQTILDVGCEAGYVALQVLKHNPEKLYGIDVCGPALKDFKKKLSKHPLKNKVVLAKAFMHKMPFKDNTFDSVICTEVIEHVPNLDQGFEEMKRVTKKSGKIIITFPNEKLRKLVYPIVKLLGVNTDVEDEVTLFEYNIKNIKQKLSKYFTIKKSYKFPFFFPMTYLIVCEKQ